jgi:hypothetical protein
MSRWQNRTDKTKIEKLGRPYSGFDLSPKTRAEKMGWLPIVPSISYKTKEINMTIVPAQKQGFGHFYDQYGMPVDGGLRMARPCRAFPSVTTIMGATRNYGLDNWKREQFALSLLTLPRLRSEPDDRFIERVDEDANAKSREAMERGTHIHNLWESLDTIKLAEQTDLDKKRVEMLSEWKNENILSIEKSETVVLNKEHGYAGRFDTLCVLKDGTQKGERCLLDLKTSDPKGKPIKPWDSHCMQLSAYRLALGEKVSCGNLMFSSTDDLQVSFHKWQEADLEKAMPAFLGIVSYWQWSNKYWPHVY